MNVGEVFTSRDLEVYRAHSLAESNGLASTQQIAGGLGLSPAAAGRRLNGMARRGLVLRNHEYRAWALTEAGCRQAEEPTVDTCQQCGKPLTVAQLWHRQTFCSDRCASQGRTRPPLARLMEKVRVDSATGCWLWRGTSSRGYGQVRFEGATRWAHRVAYELLVGPIPTGLTLDHLCRTPPCVNPAHLEPVTMGENVLRGYGPSAIHARKSHCVHGHPFDEANTHIDKRGRRICRTCNAARARENYYARKAAA